MYGDYLMTYYIVGLLVAAGLGLIPANIAKKKGYSFGLWWLYGWLLFIVAIIHVSLIPDKNQAQNPAQHPYQPAPSSAASTADELLKYKELLDAGAITQEEFDRKKWDLLHL